MYIVKVKQHFQPARHIGPFQSHQDALSYVHRFGLHRYAEILALAEA